MSDLIVPGKWICDKCGFVLLKKVLSVSNGAVGTDYNPKPDPCLNDGTPMRAYSWKEEAESMLPSMKRLEELFLQKCDDLDAANKKLADWNALFMATTMGGLPGRMKQEAGIPDLWPNPWHQDCAALAFLIKTILAERDELRDMGNMILLCGEEECRDVKGHAPKLRALIDGLIVQRQRANEAERQLSMKNWLERGE